jgi:hypothetical protein
MGVGGLVGEKRRGRHVGLAWGGAQRPVVGSSCPVGPAAAGVRWLMGHRGPASLGAA